MSLADELLADLEEEDDEDVPQDDLEDDGEEADEAMETEDQEDELNRSKDTGDGSLSSIARLSHSANFKEIMNKIADYSAKNETSGGQKMLLGPVEADPEYLLIVKANDLSAQIDNEIADIFKYAKDIYSKRFPEMETLVVSPLDYLRTAVALKNNILKAKSIDILEQILTQATIMVISVTASTTQGTDLDDSEMAQVEEACDLAINLSECKSRIFQYVESRMSYIAPNVSNIVGPSTAAKLMGAAGGLTNLSKMPSGHVSLLGQQKKNAIGFSQRSTLPHTGFIYYSELVQSVPPDLRRKVGRIVGDKCTLAARVDAQHEAADGHLGDEFRTEIEKKIDKFQEAAPVKAIKAFAVPLEAPKKKRGGRRVRKQKERYAVTELRKQANRMNFGELEEDVYQDNLGYSRGNIGKGGIGGSIRMAQVDERTKVRISQTLKKNLQKQQATGWGGTTSIKKQISGTASSVAFTPLQGLEIVNPNAAEENAERSGDQKYFSSTSAFVKVKTPAPK